MKHPSDHEPFLSEVLKSPRDERYILSYADWLEEHDDKRAGFLRHQIEFRRSPTPALRQALIETYPHHHTPWTARLEQAGVIDANLTDYEFAWWGTGIGPARETHSTYEQFRYEDQPPLPVELFDGTFGWLKESDSDGLFSTAKQWKTFCQNARSDGYFVPDEFERFMSDADLPNRIKSCTDNEFTQPSHEEIVEWNDGLFVTFYADSQYCVIWGLLLPRDPGRYAPVISGVPETFFPQRYEVDECEVGDVLAPVLAASHLEAFLYRWWIENEILYATVWDETKRPLTPVEQAYVDHLHDSTGDML